MLFRPTTSGRALGGLLGAVLGALAAYPPGDGLLARHRAVHRLSIRAMRLGGLLASWQTVGGCGAGGANGTGVKWIGRNTTGGMFQLMVLNNLIAIPPSA